MATIDFNKLICSILHPNEPCNLLLGTDDIRQALKDQNLEYKDGQIVEISGNNGGISPNPATEGEIPYEPRLKEGGRIKNFYDEKSKYQIMGIVADKYGELDYICKDISGGTFDGGVIHIGVKAVDEWAIPLEEEEIPHTQKFKEGDWVIHSGNGTISKIVEVKPYDYIIEESGGGISELDQAVIDSISTLWTILDAKEGDVITCESDIHGKPIKETGIVKQYVGKHGGCDNCFATYAFVDWDGIFFRVGEYMGSKNIHPATKEERKYFFSKMYDAGYMWDSVNKKLMWLKAEPKPDTINFKDSEELTEFEKEVKNVRDTFNKIKGLDAENKSEEPTEFEKELAFLVGHHYVCKSDPNTDFTDIESVQEYAQDLIPIARRQIVSEISVEEMVKTGSYTREHGCLIPKGYEDGIKDVLNKIKEG